MAKKKNTVDEYLAKVQTETQEADDAQVQGDEKREEAPVVVPPPAPKRGATIFLGEKEYPRTGLPASVTECQAFAEYEGHTIGVFDANAGKWRFEGGMWKPLGNRGGYA